MLNITFTTSGFTPNMLEQATPLAILVYENQGLDKNGKKLNKHVDNLIEKNIDAVNFKGKLFKSHLAILPYKAQWALLVGAGNDLSGNDNWDEQQARNIGATLYNALKCTQSKSIQLLCDVPAESMAWLALGTILSSYRFHQYFTKVKKEFPEEIILVGKAASVAQELFTKRYLPLAQGVCLARDLVTQPPNILYPASFANICQKLGNDGLDVDVLDEEALQKLGMGALLSVGQGSQFPPRLVTMHWNGDKSNEKPIAIIGKGVTFDTGGISMKPAAGMEEMKFDMGGAAVVTGLMQNLARRKAKINVVGVIALAENMPSSKAMRPSDVITSYSGQTIEVLNTDAEGRLVLADALWYAQEHFGSESLIDLATLTGAMIVTLGHEIAGLFSNNDALAEQLSQAGKIVGEKLWRLPLDDAYDKMLQSPIADMKNIGGRSAGSITAAQFLQRFIKPNVKWAHIDIAGVAWAHKATATVPKGASGFAVQLLDYYLETLTQK